MVSSQSATRTLKRAFVTNYARYFGYSQIIDRLNRRPLLHAFVRDNPNVPAFSTREEMWSFIVNEVSAAVDYLEFGVHEGHSISQFAKKDNRPNSRFFGFDCFTGLPESWNDDYRRGHFDTGGRVPPLTDPRVEFVVGMFQETLPKFLVNFKAKNKLIVNLDCDLYSSALYCLTKLDPVLTKGAIVILDEFGDVLHEFRALNDYLLSYRRQVRVICSHDEFFTIAVELIN
jgi:hypothetical protein